MHQFSKQQGEKSSGSTKKRVENSFDSNTGHLSPQKIDECN